MTSHVRILTHSTSCRTVDRKTHERSDKEVSDLPLGDEKGEGNGDLKIYTLPNTGHQLQIVGREFFFVFLLCFVFVGPTITND